jgi:hypothetical protein
LNLVEVKLYEELSLLPESYFKEALKEFTVAEGRADKVIELIAKSFKKGEYAIIGGLALRSYFKGARPLTPDVDLLISPTAKEALKNFLKEVKTKRTNVFLGSKWIMAEKDGVEIDIKIADKDYEKEALRYPKKVNYAGSTVYIIAPEYLALMKMEALRGKDEKDLMILFKLPVFKHDKFKKLLKKYMPDKIEDYKQIKLMAELSK